VLQRYLQILRLVKLAANKAPDRHDRKSFIVPRSKRFYMLIDEELERKARVTAGDIVEVAVEPSAA
jgi:hypothetical protein